MAKKVDITSKLEMGGDSVLVVGQNELEVNADAATMLKIMGMVSNNPEFGSDYSGILELYNLIFPESTRQKINELKISFTDLKIIISEAMDLIKGEEETEEGEVQTHTTT